MSIARQGIVYYCMTNHLAFQLSSSGPIISRTKIFPPCHTNVYAEKPKNANKNKTYNSWDSLVVTHPTTNQPI